MKRIITFCLLLLVVLSFPVFAENKKTTIIEVKGEINSATATHVKESIDRAEENKDIAIIFEIDTYGGSVIAAEKIKNYIVDSSIPTIAFVNNKAESAGVLITIACEKVYMSKTATIGSAETIPKTEKNISFWKGILRDTAQLRGRDEKIIEAMADSDIYIEGLSEKGKLVNLTSKESLDYKISDGIASSYEDIIEKMGLESKGYYIADTSLSVSFMNFISSQTVTTMLLVLGMLGFVLEIFSPGFGVGGITAIISFSLFFIGNNVAGNSNIYSVLIFILGLILIFIEVMVPGFGFPGIAGIVAIITGIILAMKSIEIAILSIAIAMVITLIFVVFLVKKGAKLRLFNMITLSNTSSSDRGYLSVDSSEVLVGEKGKTVSVLKPTGYISINGNKYEAISEDGFIEKDQDIVVSKVETFKIFVRRI